jgi:hypothetical protein
MGFVQVGLNITPRDWLTANLWRAYSDDYGSDDFVGLSELFSRKIVPPFVCS